MPECGLKREYVQPPLHNMYGMAMPQLVWVNMKTGGSSTPSGWWMAGISSSCPYRDRKALRGRAEASALLATADGQIRGPRRVATPLLTAGHVLHAGSQNRKRRHPDRCSNWTHHGGASQQLSDNKVAKRSGSLCASKPVEVAQIAEPAADAATAIVTSFHL